MRVGSAALLLLVLAVPARAGRAETAATLRALGIAPDRTGIETYLRSLHPSAQVRREVEVLIGQLSSADPVLREAATLKLAAYGAAPLAALRAADGASDPEAVRRIRQLSDRAEQIVSPRVLQVVMRAIAEDGMKGLAAEVLGAVRLTSSEIVLRLAQDALQATARPEDAALFRRTVASDARDVERAAAAGALAALCGREAEGEIRALLADRADRVRFAAAWCLANWGDRGGLETLGRLLTAPDVVLRTSAVTTLRSVSGKSFGYSAFDATEESAAPWRKWIAGEGATATWDTPLRRGAYHLGRILVADYQANVVMEFDEAGRETWRMDAPQPWSLCGAANGMRILSHYGNKLLVVHDAKGEEVRRIQLQGWPTSVQHLENGNLLVSSGHSTSTVYEVRPDGAKAWEIHLDGCPTGAERLDDGRTLVALQKGNLVIEVDRAGQVLWELKGPVAPYSAHRLENGNTLVVEAGGGKVTEYSQAGVAVWSKEGFQSCCSAQRLPNGDTMICDRSGVRLIDPSGEERWILQRVGTLYAYAY